ncbi:MAG: UDP-N-acetylmuramate--L-alanine ligase, partial [Clostridia bacterium]|nr:UDP-N-acetylmuramate--L-alanine ligase [Clostridia bacterium]
MNNCLFNQRYFLVGIGGISMSAIAEYLIKKGCFVSGSDLTDGFETKKLRSLGARIFIGHDGKNVFGSDAVIYNSAVKPDNPELYAARKLGLPVVDRVAFLNKIADGFSLKIGVAGCHGKTTATAMLAGVLRQARKKFLMHLGGEDIDCGNMYFSGNDIFLTEVCEFNRNIDRFDTDVSCVLNVGFDHADCYRDIEDIKNAYYYFLDRSDFRIVNADDEYLSRYGKDALSFGLYRGDIIARNVSLNGGMPEFQVKYGGKDLKINLSVYGEHNVYNALCAVAAGKLLGISGETVAEGLERFKGIKRRFEKTGYINGAEVVCDYAHHPTEL